MHTCEHILTPCTAHALFPRLGVCLLEQTHDLHVIGRGSPIPGSGESNGKVHPCVVVLSCSGRKRQRRDRSHLKPQTGGREVCHNRYVTSVPVSWNRLDGWSALQGTIWKYMVILSQAFICHSAIALCVPQRMQSLPFLQSSHQLSAS